MTDSRVLVILTDNFKLQIYYPPESNPIKWRYFWNTIQKRGDISGIQSRKEAIILESNPIKWRYFWNTIQKRGDNSGIKSNKVAIILEYNPEKRR